MIIITYNDSTLNEYPLSCLLISAGADTSWGSQERHGKNRFLLLLTPKRKQIISSFFTAWGIKLDHKENLYICTKIKPSHQRWFSSYKPEEWKTWVLRSLCFLSGSCGWVGTIALSTALTSVRPFFGPGRCCYLLSPTWIGELKQGGEGLWEGQGAEEARSLRVWFLSMLGLLQGFALYSHSAVWKWD